VLNMEQTLVVIYRLIICKTGHFKKIKKSGLCEKAMKNCSI
jgi:hypothetical protein